MVTVKEEGRVVVGQGVCGRLRGLDDLLLGPLICVLTEEADLYLKVKEWGME